MIPLFLLLIVAAVILSIPGLRRAIGRTLSLIWMIAIRGVVGACNHIAPYAHIYLTALLTTVGLALTIVPIFTALKVFGGWTWCGYVAAYTAVALTAILGLLWSPLGVLIGMLRGWTAKPLEVGERYVRTVGIIIFAEIMLAMFVLLVPFHQNLGMLPLFFLAGMAVVLSTAVWGGYLGARFYKLVALTVFMAVTASFFLPHTFAAAGERASGIDDSLASVIKKQPATTQPPAQPQQQRIVVAIQPDKWSEWITITQKCNWEAPGWVEFLFPGGKTIRVGDNERKDLDSIPDKSFRLRGKAGTVVFTPI